MAEFEALPNWPSSVHGDLVTQRSIVRSYHGATVEQALRHLAGWGWLHSSVQTAYDTNYWLVSSGNTETLGRIRMLPFGRALEIGILCDGSAVGNLVDLTYTVTCGSQSLIQPKPTAGLDSAYGDYGVDQYSLDYDVFVFDEVGDGSTASDQAVDITLECGGAGADLRVFGFYIRQPFNTRLSQE